VESRLRTLKILLDPDGRGLIISERISARKGKETCGETFETFIWDAALNRLSATSSLQDSQQGELGWGNGEGPVGAEVKTLK